MKAPVKPIAFINYAYETFTPTTSGALATILHEVAIHAREDGYDPVVFSGGSSKDSYTDVKRVEVLAPRTPSSKLGIFLARAERKVLGYRHMGHRAYAAGVVRSVRNSGFSEGILFVLNDPELIVVLRRHFPRATLIHWFQNQHGAKDRFRRQFGSAVNKVAAVSGYTARWVEDHFNLPKNSVKTVHNGAKIHDFAPADPPPPGKPVINFVGRTGIEKAPDTVLKAALELSNERTDFALQLLGSNHWDRFEMDGYQRELSTLAQKLEERGIEVRRPGFIDRYSLPSELRKASIHVVPSRWEEPCALTLFEGLATGLPVVASRTGGTPEIVGDAGLLFEKDNVAELTNHFRTLISDPELRKAYGRKARARAENFSWKTTWTGLRSLIEN